MDLLQPDVGIFNAASRGYTDALVGDRRLTAETAETAETAQTAQTAEQIISADSERFA
jgi:hypothetical protein